MMKRWISLLIAIMLMLTMTAFADDNGYLGEMRVVNCKEWVSLREYPDSSSTRLIKVPLGAIVYDCRKENSEFTYAEYNGWCGYIQSKYLSKEAGNGYIGTMTVVNCKEWVSLREYPDSSSTRLIKVPLGAIVENCWWENSEFIYAEYNGWCGYIMAQYLSEGGNYGMSMRVVNCSEWVSLRDAPSTSANRRVKVPLGAVVYNCQRENTEFYYCEYNGNVGYILAEYLSPLGSVDAASSATY